MTLSSCPLDQLSSLTLLPSSDGRRLQSTATIWRLLVKQLIYSNSTFHTWYLMLGNIFIGILSLLTVLVFICPCFPCQDSAGSHYSSCHWWSAPPNQQLPYLCQLQPTPPTLPPSPTATIIHAHLLHVQLLDLLMVGCTPDLNWSPVNLVFMSLPPVCFLMGEWDHYVVSWCLFNAAWEL